jgi:hypothetical protein
MRSIREIACDIIFDMENISKNKGKNWKAVFWSCHPQIEAMLALQTTSDKYFFDDATSIICSALANMGTYRGSNAKNYKNELRAMVGLKTVK